jgi:uncharacterized SAM-binding protein YcdF (DUF218 family)
MTTAEPVATGRRWNEVGADGLFTLLLSNLWIAATFGISLAWQAARVFAAARGAGTKAPPLDVVLVLGLRLRDGRPTREYARRLIRAQRLRAGRPRCRILLLGGRSTPGSASEAEAGAQFLVARGVPRAALTIERRSVHTLDNLRHARSLLRPRAAASVVLVSSRYHLARSAALAHGLGLRAVPCAAEDALGLDLDTVWRLAREAYLLHWYAVGRTWSSWTNNRKSLAKIT